MKPLKEKVLQKCAELWGTDFPRANGFDVHKNSGGWWDIRRFDSELAACIYGNALQHYRVANDVPETDLVWPLAAQVLGIGGDEKGHNYVKELLRQAFLQGRDTSLMPEKDALANFHRAEKEYYLPRFGNPQNLIDALQKIAADGNERDFDAAEFAEMAIEDWEQNGKIPFAVKSFEGPTIRQLLEENIRLLKIQAETPKPNEV